MSKIRYDETEKFPFDWDGAVWYVLIDQNLNVHKFGPSKIRKRQLLKIIEDFRFAKMKFVLFGVWHGEWRTDLFFLDPEITTQKLKVVI